MLTSTSKTKRKGRIATCHGVRVPIDLELLSPTIISAINAGTYEAAEVAQIPRIIEPSERILEIGSGLGVISTIAVFHPYTAALRVFGGNPDLIRIIGCVHRLNGVRADIVNRILRPSPKKKSVPFYVRRDMWASSLSPQPGGYERVVHVETADLRLAIHRFRPTLIICDIEGGEVGPREIAGSRMEQGHG